jgi:hypothetical protein
MSQYYLILFKATPLQHNCLRRQPIHLKLWSHMQEIASHTEELLSFKEKKFAQSYQTKPIQINARYWQLHLHAHSLSNKNQSKWRTSSRPRTMLLLTLTKVRSFNLRSKRREARDTGGGSTANLLRRQSITWFLLFDVSPRHREIGNIQNSLSEVYWDLRPSKQLCITCSILIKLTLFYIFQLSSL